MHIKVCTCVQCKAQKKKKSRNHKKRIRRMLNRLRRKGDDNKVKNWYYC